MESADRDTDPGSGRSGPRGERNGLEEARRARGVGGRPPATPAPGARRLAAAGLLCARRGVQQHFWALPPDAGWLFLILTTKTCLQKSPTVLGQGKGASSQGPPCGLRREACGRLSDAGGRAWRGLSHAAGCRAGSAATDKGGGREDLGRRPPRASTQASGGAVGGRRASGTMPLSSQEPTAAGTCPCPRWCQAGDGPGAECWTAPVIRAWCGASVQHPRAVACADVASEEGSGWEAQIHTWTLQTKGRGVTPHIRSP